MAESSRPKLSICIPTYNRAHLLSQTLESIIPQLTDECEIVVSDDASPDHTESLLSKYSRECSRFSYVKQTVNLGCDGNTDQVMRLGRGEYCWLMPDDDWMKPGAISVVLAALRHDYSLVVVNKEIRTGDMSKVLIPSYLGKESDGTYLPHEMDRLLVEVGFLLMYYGSVVIKREIWTARSTQRYYGSSFVQIGAIFEEQLPGATLVMAKPLITFRHSTEHGWLSNAFEIFMFKLPPLVWSLAPSEEAKRRFTSPEPWRQFGSLLIWRGYGLYSLTEYKRFIRPRLQSLRQAIRPAFAALLPGVLANVYCVLYYSLFGGRLGKVPLEWLKGSPFYPRNWLRASH